MADLSDVAALEEADAPHGEFVSYPDSPFQLFRPYQPAGDQPAAIAGLVDATPLWVGRIGVVASTAEIFTVIQLAALFFIDLGLRLLRIEVPRIMTDIIVGLAYFIALLSILREGGVELRDVLGVGVHRGSEEGSG